MPCTMLSPGRTVVIDCETTDLPGALAVVVSLPRGLAKPGHSLARPRRQAGNWNRSGPPTPRKRCQKLQGMPGPCHGLPVRRCFRGNGALIARGLQGLGFEGL